MVSIGAITYWCYSTASLVQMVAAASFIASPPLLVPWAADSFAQYFIRVTGISLLSLTHVFWGFRHIPFQAQGSVSAQQAAMSYGCARVFARFHTLLAMLMYWAMYRLGMSIPKGHVMLGLHLAWAGVMTYALLLHHQLMRGYIIDTSSLPAAATSFKQLVQGDDGQEQRTVLQMIKGEDSSSKGVLQMFQGSSLLSLPFIMLSFPRASSSTPQAALLILFSAMHACYRPEHYTLESTFIC